MKRDKFLLIAIMLYTTKSFAIPEFAREYSVDCTTCHTMVPTLNETGKSFLRNGLRFSSGDRPTLKKIINPEKGESRPIPLSIIAKGTYDTNSEDYQSKLKLYTAGTVTKNLSFFGVTKDNLNSNNGGDNQDLFSQKSSRFYIQLNLQGDRHLVRGGLISPLTQFGNILKSSADSGLKGNNIKNQQNSSNFRGRNNQNQKYGTDNSNRNNQRQGQNSAGRGFRGNNHYQTPIQNASIGIIKGVEYSYLFNNKLMALVSYGKSIDRGNRGENRNGNGRNQNILQQYNDSDDYQFIGGLQYNTDSRYSFGVIYNRFENMGEDSFSILIPIEKDFDNTQIVSTLVYRDETLQEDNYYGIENSIIYSITPNDYIRGIVDYGVEDSKDSYGLSLTYSKIYRYILLHLTGARRDSGESGENLFLGSISLMF